MLVSVAIVAGLPLNQEYGGRNRSLQTFVVGLLMGYASVDAFAFTAVLTAV